MSDLIKREDAIETIHNYWKKRLDTLPTKESEYGEVYTDIQQMDKILEYNKVLCNFIKAIPSADRPHGWIPCSERLPSEEERKEWIDNNLDGIGYLYPCLVTRYSSINPDRTKNNPYVAKHYFDGEDFVNCGEEVCSEYILAWMPLPKPWKGADDE